MKSPVQKIALGGLVATIAIAAIMIVQLRAQQAAQIAGDFSNAQTAEIRDAQGGVLLRGTFAVAEQDAGEEDEVERKAPLTAASGGATAGAGAGRAMTGEAEVEYQKATPAMQEVEFTVIGLPAGTAVTLVIDGTTVASATADKNGKAEAEVEVKGAGQ